ncbi:MAG: hypothetical protein AB9880_10070 [Christensenellales bacterium]
MKRYMVILTCLLLLSLLTAAGQAQAAEQVTGMAYTVHFQGFDRTGPYSGAVENGLPQGSGSFSASNDEEVLWTYTGQWLNGAMDGEGATVWEDGYEERGLYAQNVLLRGQVLDKGVPVYEGSFAWNIEAEDNLYHGDGKLYNTLGRLIWEGQFENGCLVETAIARTQRAEALSPSSLSLKKADYDAILKSEAEWIGRLVRFNGTVDYIWEKDSFGYGEFEVLLNGSSSRPFDVFYRYGVDETRIKEKLKVTVLGTITGIYRYDSGEGKPYVAPLVQADVILRTK